MRYLPDSASFSVPGSWTPLALMMLVFGITGSLVDVAINTEATEVEHRTGQALMSGFHGMFSLGGMVGAAAWS